jgi:HPt (histidine-containing phosphotransfer) domain-containing protein
MKRQDSTEMMLQVDEQAALDALDGSRVLLHDLAEIFCEDAPAILNELRSALEADDATGARRAAHSLKGLAATFFAKPTVEIAQRVEFEAAEGNLSGLMVTDFRLLAAAIESLIVELKEKVLG